MSHPCLQLYENGRAAVPSKSLSLMVQLLNPLNTHTNRQTEIPITRNDLSLIFIVFFCFRKDLPTLAKLISSSWSSLALGLWVIFLPPPPTHWHDRHVPPCLAMHLTVSWRRSLMRRKLTDWSSNYEQLQHLTKWKPACFSLSILLPNPEQGSLGQIFCVFIFPARLRRNKCLSVQCMPCI